MIYDYNHVPKEDKYGIAKDLNITPDRLEQIIRVFAKHDYFILNEWRQEAFEYFIKSRYGDDRYPDLLEMVYNMKEPEPKQDENKCTIDEWYNERLK